MQSSHAGYRRVSWPPTYPKRRHRNTLPCMSLQMAEFQSNALDLGDHEVVFNMVSYPTVCVQRRVVESMIVRCAALAGPDPPPVL